MIPPPTADDLQRSAADDYDDSPNGLCETGLAWIRLGVAYKAELAAAKAEAERLLVLAKRCYPGLKPSGLCSKHRSGQPGDYSCDTCFPDWPGLAAKHCELKQSAWRDLAAARQQIEGLLAVMKPLAEYTDDDLRKACVTKGGMLNLLKVRDGAVAALAPSGPPPGTPAPAESWQPIETAPTDGSHVLVRYRIAYAPGVVHVFVAEVWWDAAALNPWWTTADGCKPLAGIVTHWMLMPLQPGE